MSSFEQVLPDEKAVLTGFREALKLFRDLDTTMPLLTAFLSVATKEGQNVAEYAKIVGTSQSLMTRHLADIGQTNRHHESGGFGLVEAYDDVTDPRNRLHRLSAKGQLLVGQLLGALAK